MDELIISIVDSLIKTNYFQEFKEYLKKNYKDLYDEIYVKKQYTKNELFIAKMIRIYNEYAATKKDFPNFNKLYEWAVINRNAQNEEPDTDEYDLWMRKKK